MPLSDGTSGQRARSWWQQLAAVMLKEAKQVTRDPSSLIIAVVLPLTFLFLFGYGISLATTVERWPVERRMDRVVLDGMTIRMKVSAGRVKPEFDDVAAVAHKTRRPVAEVASRAEEAWRAGRTRHDAALDGPLD